MRGGCGSLPSSSFFPSLSKNPHREPCGWPGTLGKSSNSGNSYVWVRVGSIVEYSMALKLLPRSSCYALMNTRRACAREGFRGKNWRSNGAGSPLGKIPGSASSAQRK